MCLFACLLDLFDRPQIRDEYAMRSLERLSQVKTIGRIGFWYFSMAAKVLVGTLLTSCAMAYLFGFASALFDMLAAGYLAAGLATCMGVGTTVAIIVKDVRRNRSAKEIKE